MTFNVYEVPCRVVGFFRPNKPTIRQIRDANDFVDVKNHACRRETSARRDRKACSQGRNDSSFNFTLHYSLT